MAVFVGVKFIESAGWAARVLSRPLARAVTESRASSLAGAIEGNAPHDSVNDSSTGTGIGPLGTAATKITMYDPRWHIFEYGSAKYPGVHNAPLAPVRRAVDSSGMKWVQE